VSDWRRYEGYWLWAFGSSPKPKAQSPKPKVQSPKLKNTGMPIAVGLCVPSRIRVLHAAPYLWSGAGRVITDLLDSQRQRHTVALVTSPRSGELRNWPAYDRRIAALRIRHERIDLFHRDGATFWPAVAQMQRAIDSFKPDVIHTHAGTPTAIASLARQASSRVDTPIASHFYSWGIGRPQRMNEMDLCAFISADRVICSARAYRDVLLAGGIAKRRLQMMCRRHGSSAESAVSQTAQNGLARHML